MSLRAKPVTGGIHFLLKTKGGNGSSLFPPGVSRGWRNAVKKQANTTNKNRDHYPTGDNNWKALTTRKTPDPIQIIPPSHRYIFVALFTGIVLENAALKQYIPPIIRIVARPARNLRSLIKSIYHGFL